MDDSLQKMSITDEDEIICQIPICHSTRLENNLYGFRYSLLSKDNLKDLLIRKGYFKPENQDIQLDLCMEVESSSFQSDRAEIMAHKADGPLENRQSSNVYFENEIVDKVTLESLEESDKFAIMAFNGKEIHLSALKSVFEFRPTFHHIDKGLKKRKDVKKDRMHTSDDEQEAGPSGMQQITVKFKQTEKSKKDQKCSFKELEMKRAEEPWTECNFCSENSTVSQVERLKLFADNMEATKQAMNLSKSEYLEVLIPEDKEEAAVEPTLPAHIMSLHALRALPIQEQCKLLLKHANIIQFQQLLMTLAGSEGVTADALLKTLPKVAVLVRGNWVVKSEVLYPNNTLSAISGVPSDLMCRARDYVLYLFTKNQYVERKKVSSVTKIPSEEVKEIFTGFSKLSHNKGWELVLPTDHEFIARHGDVVQRQSDLWEQKFLQISSFLKDTKRQRRKSKSVSEDNSKVKNGPSYMSSDESGTEKNKSPVAARQHKTLKMKDTSWQDSSS